MAYISTEEVARIRAEVKAAFPKYKFSISRHHCSEVLVYLMSADFDAPANEQINHYYLSDYSADIQRVFSKVEEIVEGVKVNYDSNAGDMSADYPNYNYFKHYEIGKWNKHYEKKVK